MYIRKWIVFTTFILMLNQIYNIFFGDNSLATPSTTEQIVHWAITVVISLLVVHSYKKNIKSVYFMGLFLHIRIYLELYQDP